MALVSIGFLPCYLCLFNFNDDLATVLCYKLKDEIMNLPVEEQFEIYNTLQEKFEKPEDFELTPEQMEFINERLDILESGNYTSYTIEDLKARLELIKK